ncbi:UPF0102 protein [Clostridia bacterium]|nr:UPF0102 protein [Clostridia bacterium]
MTNAAKNDALAFGRIAEDQASAFLQNRGYIVLDRNYHTRTGEVDIVARYGETVAFVEVKARGGSAYGYPREAVDRRKQSRVVKTASSWLYKHGLDEANVRFDVIEIYGGRIYHWRNAFDATDMVA